MKKKKKPIQTTSKGNAVSRKRNRLAVVLLAGFVVLVFGGAFLEISAIMAAGLICAVCGFILMFTTNRCPYCRKYFSGLYWSESAGYCSKCGGKIFFDDEV